MTPKRITDDEDGPKPWGRPLCMYQAAPEREDVEEAVRIMENGGNLTPWELAHSGQFQRVGMAWTRSRANRMIRAMQAEGKWADAHAHGDGSVWLLRGTK